MRVRRNFGTMHPDWQDRQNKKRLTGFTVTFQDGTVQDIHGGLAGISDQPDYTGARARHESQSHRGGIGYEIKNRWKIN